MQNTTIEKILPELLGALEAGNVAVLQVVDSLAGVDLEGLRLLL